MSLARQIVVCHYAHSLAWLTDLAKQGWDTLAYIKRDGPGNGKREHFKYNIVPNVGWDGYAYLTHIVENYNDLADYTLFCQDDPTDHLPAGVRVESLFDGPPSPWKGYYWTGREWDRQGRLCFNREPWLSKWRDGRITRATQTLAEWFAEWLGMDLFSLRSITYVPGANFVASRQAILARPHKMWAALRDRINHAVEPEECHYLERSWCYLLE